MDWLKQILGEDLYNELFPKEKSDLLKKVTDKVGTKKIIEEDGKLIPKHRFDEISNKLNDPDSGLKAVTDKLTNLQKQYDELKTQKDTGKTEVEKKLESLTKELNELKTMSSEKDKLLSKEKKNSALTTALTNAKANPKYLSLLKKEFDLDKIELDENGEIKGFAELIKPIQENFRDLFGEVKLSGTGPQHQNNQQDNFTEMTEAEYYASKAGK